LTDPRTQAREQNPFLARFVGDWATKEIVKQFLKNKRRNHYRNGWLDVPEKYAYLKNNASKRDPTGSRKKKALSGLAITNSSQGPSTQMRNGKKVARPRVTEDSNDNDEEDDEEEEDGDEEEEDGDEEEEDGDEEEEQVDDDT
jgi:hypothetical protein